MKTVRRSDMVIPAWIVILGGSAAFVYCAYAGLL